MNIPSSFCTICTYPCHRDLIGLLLSLSIHHPNKTLYCMSDTKTKHTIDILSNFIKLSIIWDVTLNKYDGMDRILMTKNNLWNEFQMKKAEVIKLALQNEKDTLFLDSDIFILHPIDTIDKTKNLGISPHYIKKKDTDKYGYYNGGVLWTNQNTLPDKWNHYTKTSRFYDQASIEDLAKDYKYFEFDKGHNFGWWRVLQSDESARTIMSYVSIKNNIIYYQNYPLRFVHTHFTNTKYRKFNKFIINCLIKAKLYKELLILDRIIDGYWTIKIPKHPINGYLFHINNSFKELMQLWQNNSNDNIKILYDPSIKHVYIGNNIVLQDIQTDKLIDNNILKSLKVLIDNVHIHKEDNKIPSNHPLIYSPLNPSILENIIDNTSYNNYDNRKYNTIFIGECKNNVQEKIKISTNCYDVIDLLCVTKNITDLYTQEHYLNKLSDSRFGLCLHDCNTNYNYIIEYMAFGTVPLITSNVLSAYVDPLIENIHYIKINNPANIKNKIDISKEKWTAMSHNCINWYTRNVLSYNSWKRTLEFILHDSIDNNNIYLVQQFFIHPNEKRQKEIMFCLKQNVNIKHIRLIYLLNEKIYTQSELGLNDIEMKKIKQINIGNRLLYSDVFLYVNKLKLSGYIVFSNSDIFFDNTLIKCKDIGLIEKKCVCALLRYEYNLEYGNNLNKSKLYTMSGKLTAVSQDTWIYHTDNKLDDNMISLLNFNFGIPGCDNHFAYLMNSFGYKCLNIPWTIKTYHLHTTNIRNYNVKNKIKGRYLKIIPTKI